MFGVACALAVVAVVLYVFGTRPAPSPLPPATGGTTVETNAEIGSFTTEDSRKVQPVDLGTASPGPRPRYVEPASEYSSQSLSAQKAAAAAGELVREVDTRTTSVATAPPARPAGRVAHVRGLSSSVAGKVAAVMRLAVKFSGDSLLDTPSPPDMQIAAGPKYIIEVDNAKLSMWTKMQALNGTSPPFTTALGATRNDNGRYNGIFPMNEGLGITDPSVQYDQDSNRFFMTALVFDSVNDSALYLAVSNTDDPRNGWRVFPITGMSNRGRLHDQPKLAVNRDHVVITWTEIEGLPPGSVQGSMWKVISKAELLARRPRVVAEGSREPSGCDFGLIPARAVNSSTELYLLELVPPDAAPKCQQPIPRPSGPRGNHLRLWRISGSAVQHDVKATISDIEVPPYLAPPSAAQKSTTPGAADSRLDTNDTRFRSAVMRGKELWAADHIACRLKTEPGKAANACVQIVKVATSGDPKSVRVFTLAKSGQDYYYPVLAVNRAGDVFVAMETSSRNTFPSIAFASHFAGADFRWQPSVLEVGRHPIQCLYDSLFRIGDYIGIDVDRADDRLVWIAAEVSRTDRPTCNQDVVVGGMRYDDGTHSPH